MMLTYDQLKTMKPREAVEYLDSRDKKKVSDYTVADLINPAHLDTILVDAQFRDLSPNGVYIFYNEHYQACYVGQSSRGFYERLMSQLDPTYTPFFGWNSLLRKIGGRLAQKPETELSKEILTEALEIVKGYYLHLIAAPAAWEKSKLLRLESLLMKAYRSHYQQVKEGPLLNTRMGWLWRDEDWTKTLDELMNE